ncbi:MAG: hypothetical protein HYS13_00070 [Planctomycetia bacterium]|nr:hypothetical protein [Planctomycetia bacterium]
MSVRVTYGEFQYECETPEEAARLTQVLAGKVRPRRRVAGAAGNNESSGTADYSGFWKALSDNAKKAVVALRDADTELETSEFAKKMGVQPQSIKYAMKTVRAAAERNGVDPESVISAERILTGGKPRSKYRMAAEVRAGLSKMK